MNQTSKAAASGAAAPKKLRGHSVPAAPDAGQRTAKGQDINFPEWILVKKFCEAANPLQAPKPRKNQSRSKNRSKVGFLETRKVGRKIGRKVGQKGFPC